MQTLDYSYDLSLQSSIKNAWTVDDVFRGRDFDFTKPFLPERIAGVNGIDGLNPDEKRMLNQIRANSYCHIFAFVEEFIVPLVVDQARADVYGNETRLWALLRFAEEEVKHQEMLHRAGQQFEAGLGVTCDLVPGREAVAGAVLTTSPLAALLLTSMIEWFTQLHFVEHVRDRGELDELFRDILRFHWIDESRHARMDSLLIGEIAGDLSADQRDQALSELLDLGAPSTGFSPSRSTWTSTPSSGPPGAPSANRTGKTSVSTGTAPTGGPSWYRAWNTPTSSESWTGSALWDRNGSPRPRRPSPPDHRDTSHDGRGRTNIRPAPPASAPHFHRRRRGRSSPRPGCSSRR